MKKQLTFEIGDLLREGIMGSKVAAWQAFLWEHHIRPANRGGLFGPSTTKGTIKFQKKYGLKPDGVVGPKTLQVAVDLQQPPIQPIEGNNVCVVYSSRNSKGKSDAKGAFIPEAQSFSRVHGIPPTGPKKGDYGINCINVPYKKRRAHLYDILSTCFLNTGPIDVLALFCHGWPNGIQFGVTRPYIPEFVEVLKKTCARNVKIVLYACLCAENDVRDRKLKNIGIHTDGGFADCLRDEMVRQGFRGGWVDAHKPKGHTTENPFVVRFPFEGSLVGGGWLVQPQSEFWRRWVKAMHSKSDMMRFNFPVMTEMEIKRRLGR